VLVPSERHGIRTPFQSALNYYHIYYIEFLFLAVHCTSAGRKKVLSYSWIHIFFFFPTGTPGLPGDTEAKSATLKPLPRQLIA
jgi:hypothetical protein